jgi:oligoendopeptidase F
MMGDRMNTLSWATGMRFVLIRLIAASLVGAMLTSCAPTYDNVADQMLVDTQKQADDGLLKLENLGNQIDQLKKSPNASDQNTITDAEAQASYASNIDFYSKLQSSMIVLDERMTSNPDVSTQKITASLKALEDNIDSVRQTHATQNTVSSDFAKITRGQMDQQFKALTVYELTIKNGSKPR